MYHGIGHMAGYLTSLPDIRFGTIPKEIRPGTIPKEIRPGTIPKDIRPVTISPTPASDLWW